VVRSWTSICTAAAALTLAACGGRAETIPVPEEPEATIRAFMAAVRGSDLRAMADLWGTSRGPASRSMSRTELEQRLTVIRIYLAHDSYEILPPGLAAEPNANERAYTVRLARRGCTPAVPFTLVRYGAGWIVASIDLAAAGNPARSCDQPAQPPGAATR
jgi:hypothetical protein